MQLDFKGPVETHFRKFEEEWLEVPVFQLFREVVQRNPDKIAIKCGTQELSYEEAYHWSLQIAQQINASNAGHEPVGIALPNDVFFPVAMMASLAVGCPYVPLDIDLPLARNQTIIEQSGIKCIITTNDSPLFLEGLHTINIDNLAFIEDNYTHFKSSPDSIAYIIYTSGSTGTPKGVYQNQRNLLHDVMQYTNSVHLNENDRLTLLYSPSVNGAIRDIYGALLNGATLVIKNLKKTGLYDLGEFIRHEGITIYHSIPNIFRTFLKLSPDKTDFASVRLIYLAGDRIYNTDVDLYTAFFPAGCLLYVGIGATEIATIYRQWFINHATIINQELIPLGYPVEDREMFLLNEEGNQVPEGDIGEICVSSQFISLGYWKNPNQTAEFFSENQQNPSVRTYRTGDLGRINDDGLLEFIGRKDNQVKINGYRVELSEIEGVLMNHPSIERCGLVLHTADKHNAIFAFYISDEQIPEIRLKSWIGERLPNYMIPQRCFQVSAIPILHNFKNDNNALKTLALEYTKTEQKNPESTNTKTDFLFSTLRRTWTNFLDEKSFDTNSKWKDAGGDSLNAVNFLVQLESDLGTNLPTDWIHGEMTPDEIYAYLNALNLSEKASSTRIVYFFPSLMGMHKNNTKAFLNRLSEFATLRIINYPKFSNTPPENRNLDYVTTFIAKQIPDYNNSDIGFVSTCSGAVVMNHMLASIHLEQYGFIGIIEGREMYVAKPLYKNFWGRAMIFFSRGDVFNNSIFYLYNHSDYCKKLIHYLERKNYYSFKNRQVLWSIYQYLRPSYFDGEVLYFGCTNSMMNATGEHWKPHYKKINLVSLEGLHDDMLNADNAQLIINKMQEALDKQKVGI